MSTYCPDSKWFLKIDPDSFNDFVCSSWLVVLEVPYSMTLMVASVPGPSNVPFLDFVPVFTTIVYFVGPIKQRLVRQVPRNIVLS